MVKKVEVVKEVIATHPVQDNSDLLKEMEELRQKVKDGEKIATESRELEWIYQLKNIGFIDNAEIYKNDKDDCLIKKYDKKPVDSVCLRNYFERMRGGNHTQDAGQDKPAKRN